MVIIIINKEIILIGREVYYLVAGGMGFELPQLQHLSACAQPVKHPKDIGNIRIKL
jgi:hypothetical protein